MWPRARLQYAYLAGLLAARKSYCERGHRPDDNPILVEYHRRIGDERQRCAAEWKGIYQA